MADHSTSIKCQLKVISIRFNYTSKNNIIKISVVHYTNRYNTCKFVVTSFYGALVSTMFPYKRWKITHDNMISAFKNPWSAKCLPGRCKFYDVTYHNKRWACSLLFFFNVLSLFISTFWVQNSIETNQSLSHILEGGRFNTIDWKFIIQQTDINISNW